MSNLSTVLKKGNTDFHDQLMRALLSQGITYKQLHEDGYELIFLTDYDLLINPIALTNNFKPQELIQLQKKYQKRNQKLIQLWQDVWETKTSQVIARIKSLAGLNKRIHGRKTQVFKLTKPVADSFLNENHLQGSVSSRYKFGLFEHENLVAVATFSALRKMNHTSNYKSAELIRFAVKAGCTVTGGLSKLIKYFVAQLNPNDLMTYSDKDWSAGEAYIKLGFNEVDTLDPQFFTLDAEFNRSLKKIENNECNNVEVFNTGSSKYILKF